MGLLDAWNLLTTPGVDPETGLLNQRAMAAQSGLAGMTNAFGALSAAFAPSLQPGGLGRGLAMVGPAVQQGMQGVQQRGLLDQRTAIANRSQQRDQALNEALSNKSPDEMTPMGREMYGVVSKLPETARAGLLALDPSERGQFIGRYLAAQGQGRELMNVSPGGRIFDPVSRQEVYAAPFAPQRAPLPGPYDHIRIQPDGSIYDLRQLGGAPQPQTAPPPGPGASAQPPPNMYGRNAPMVAQRDAMLGSPPEALAAASGQRAQAVGQPLTNPANAPWAADLSPPTGTIPVTGGAQPAPMPRGMISPPRPPEWSDIPTPEGQSGAWQRNNRTGEVRRTGSNNAQVTTNVFSDKTLAGNLADNAGKGIEAARGAAMRAVEGAQSSDRIIALLDNDRGAITGTMANWRVTLENALATAGLVDGERVANSQQLASELAKGTLASAEALKGPTSDRDILFLREVAAGSIEMNPQTLRRVARISREINQRAVTEYNDLIAPLQEDANQNPMVRHYYRPVQIPSFVSTPRQGGQADTEPRVNAAPPDKPNLPQMRSLQDAARLPPGTRFIDPQGVERIRP